MSYELILKNEIKNRPLPPCNKIHALNIPAGVKVFISWVEAPQDEDIFEINNNSIIALEKNKIPSRAKIPYLSTIGTSSHVGKLLLADVNKDYINVIQDGNNIMDLREDVTQQLLNLDKLIHPFKEELFLNVSPTRTTAGVTLLEIQSCSFDEIEFLISCIDDSAYYSLIDIAVDEISIYNQIVNYNSGFKANIGNFNAKIKHLKGKRLKISYSGSVKIHATKKTLKV